MSTKGPKDVSKTVADYERQRGGGDLTARQARRVRKKERKLKGL
jgi:hypothetical protein